MPKHRRPVGLAALAVLLIGGLVVESPPLAGAATQRAGKTPDAATVQAMVAVARELVNGRNASLITSPSTAPAARVYAPSFGRASQQMVAGEAAAATELGERRALLAELGEQYTDAKSTVDLVGIDTNGDRLTLRVNEYTELYYKKLRGDEPDYTAWVVERNLAFRWDGATWVLESASLGANAYVAPVNEPTGASSAAMKGVALAIEAEAVRLASAPVAPKTARTQAGYVAAAAPYNYTAMAAYAEQYWRNYNPNYRTFNDTGGDCTNFISQAMRAGGWPDASPGFYRDDNYWWYNWLNQTWTWINVQYWYTFAAVRSHRTFILATPDSMLLADVLQADFTANGSKDHTMIVSYRSSGASYLTYHTTDTFRRSLSSLMLAYPTARWLPHRT